MPLFCKQAADAVTIQGIFVLTAGHTLTITQISADYAYYGNTGGHCPLYVDSAYLTSPHVTRSPKLFPSIFAIVHTACDQKLEMGTAWE